MSNLGPQFEGRPYFHGTGGAITGGVVQPNSPSAYRGEPEGHPLRRPAAYGSIMRKDGERAAGHAAQKAGRLFGSVYEVDPINVVGTDGPDKYGIPSPTGVGGHIADPDGLKVRKHAGFVNHSGAPL